MPEDSGIPKPEDLKKTTEELKNQAKATDDLAKSTEAAADATSKLDDASKKAASARKDQIDDAKTQAKMAEQFEKISFGGIFKARMAMKGFMKSLGSLDGKEINASAKIEGLSDLADAFQKLSTVGFLGARRAKKGMKILGGALVDMQKMAGGPLTMVTTGLGDMSKMMETMGGMGFFAGRRVKKFLSMFISQLTPFMKDISKLDTGPALEPIFKMIDGFSEFADKGNKAKKAVKSLAKAMSTVMGMKIKAGKAAGGKGSVEEVEREKERIENERHAELISTLQGMMSGGKGGDKKKGGIFGLISGLLGGAGGGIAKMASGVVKAFGAVVNTITEIVEKFVHLIRTVISTIIDIVQKIATAIADVITKIGSAIATVIEKTLTALGRGLAAMGSGPALLGALALLVVAAGIFVLSKAFVEFTKVNFKTLAIGIIAIVALTAVMMGLGMLMASGVGAVALLLGAAAMLVIAGAALVLGIAFQTLGEGLTLIMSSLGSFLNDVLPGFLRMANPGVGAGLVLAAAGIVVLTAAIVGFMAVLTLAGAAGAAGGIVSGVLGSVSSFFGGPGPPPGPFEMLDKFIGFAEAAPFLQKGADAIGVIGSALSTFLTMNFAAVGAELGQLAMILLSFDAVSLGLGGAAGAAVGFLSFGLIKAKSPLDILKELVKLAPDVKKLGDGIHNLSQGMEVLAGIDGSAIASSLPTADSMGKVASSTSGVSKRDKMLGKFKQERSELVSDMKDDEEFFGSMDYAGRTEDRARLRELNARISKMESQSPSSGGYAPGAAMDSSQRRLEDAKEKRHAAFTPPSTNSTANVSVMNNTQFVGGMGSVRSSSAGDDDAI